MNQAVFQLAEFSTSFLTSFLGEFLLDPSRFFNPERIFSKIGKMDS